MYEAGYASSSQDNPWLSSLGLLREEGSPKPAYGALRAAAARLTSKRC